MKKARRRFLLQTVLGTGMWGLRAAASGIPIAILQNPERAFAQSTMPFPEPVNPQYLILNTSQLGDPINCNAPGTYDVDGVVHPNDPRMSRVDVNIGGRVFGAARPWSLLSDQFERTSFIHHQTDTEQHLHQPDVHRLMGRVAGNDMMISAYSALLAPALGTIQTEPVVIGTTDSSEAISAQGRTQPLLNPRSLATVLTAPEGPLRGLQDLRDRDLNRLNQFFRSRGNASQRSFLDSYATSRDQARQLEQNLLSQLSSIRDNGPNAQMDAAVVLVQLKVSPVITVHIPFGGDNHFDANLGMESDETVAGMATVQRLMNTLGTENLADRVTFASFNVFGRTLLLDGPGRSHNRFHHVTVLIGRHVRGSVIGGIERNSRDYGATAFDSQTGLSTPDGDITQAESLASAGKTLGRSLGLSAEAVDATVAVPNTGMTVGRAATAALR